MDLLDYDDTNNHDQFVLKVKKNRNDYIPKM